MELRRTSSVQVLAFNLNYVKRKMVKLEMNLQEGGANESVLYASPTSRIE